MTIVIAIALLLHLKHLKSSSMLHDLGSAIAISLWRHCWWLLVWLSWSILSFRPPWGLSPLPWCTQVSNPRVIVFSSTSRQSSDFLASSTTSSATQAAANFFLSCLYRLYTVYTSMLCCGGVTSCHPRAILITVSSTHTSMSEYVLNCVVDMFGVFLYIPRPYCTRYKPAALHPRCFLQAPTWKTVI